MAERRMLSWFERMTPEERSVLEQRMVSVRCPGCGTELATGKNERGGIGEGDIWT